MVSPSPQSSPMPPPQAPSPMGPPQQAPSPSNAQGSPMGPPQHHPHSPTQGYQGGPPIPPGGPPMSQPPQPPPQQQSYPPHPQQMPPNMGPQVCFICCNNYASMLFFLELCFISCTFFFLEKSERIRCLRQYLLVI